MQPSSTVRASGVLSVLAAGLWLGGMLALGAVVAPIVFRTVPAPASADAMTLVFRRFDKVAMTCGVVLLAAEAWRATAYGRGAVSRVTRLDVARIGAVVVAVALAAWQGLVLSPGIAGLHARGAVRGDGVLGRELDALHKLAEREAKGQVALVAIFLVLLVWSLSRPASQETVHARRGAEVA